MRYYLDTEFIDDGRTVEPLSLALVREDGMRCYLEFQRDHLQLGPWHQKNILPYLTWPDSSLYVPRGQWARETIQSFIGTDTPEFWAYYADYDWLVFCQCFGRMLDLPTGWPRICLDLQQEFIRMGRPQHLKPADPTGAHNALVDAKWCRAFHANLLRAGTSW